MNRHRVRAAGAGLVLAAIAAAGCGSSSGSGSRTAVVPPAAPAAPATAAAPTNATHLERDLARSFEDAFFTAPRPATLSQVPPRTDLFVRDPAIDCAAVHPAGYRCTVTYNVRTSADTQHMVYDVRRRHDCFTATAVATSAPRALHRLSSC